MICIHPQQTNKLQVLPTKLERTKLKEYMFASDRDALAKVTYSVAMLTEGVLSIKATTLGVQVIDPKDLLRQGVRKQLLRRIVAIMQEHLVYKQSKSFFRLEPSSGRSKDFLRKLDLASKHLNGMKRSLEYIQDYIQVHGMSIWHDELSKLLSFLCDRHVHKGKLFSSNSRISDVMSNDSLAEDIAALDAIYRDVPHSFLSSLVDEVLFLTSPFSCTYSYPLCGWFNAMNGEEEIGLHTFERIRGAVGSCGCFAMDTIMSSQIADHIKACGQAVATACDSAVKKDVLNFKFLLSNARSSAVLTQLSKIVALVDKGKHLREVCKLLPLIGQAQLVRRHISIELTSCAKHDSGDYVRALQCLNWVVVAHERNLVVGGENRTQGHEGGGEECASLRKLAAHLELTGTCDPMAKIYHRLAHEDGAGALLCVLTLVCLANYVHGGKRGVVPHTRKAAAVPDFTVVCVGLVTVLNQYPLEHRLEWMRLLRLFHKLKLLEGQATAKAQQQDGVLGAFLATMAPQLLNVDGAAASFGEEQAFAISLSSSSSLVVA